MELRRHGRSRAEEFEALAAPEEKRVYAICYHMMGNREDALDCAQETMLRAFRAFDSFRQDARFSTWISRIATNVCLDALRKRRDVVSLEAIREEKGYDPADPAPGVYARLERKERMRLLGEVMEQLPPEMRQVITLREMEGLAYDEIAQVMELPLGTVKSKVNRARERLCRILQKSSELFSSRSV